MDITDKLSEARKGGMPWVSAGICSYEGHMCCPYLISAYPRRDIRFWASHEEKDNAISALEAMWKHGYEAGRNDAAKLEA